MAVESLQTFLGATGNETVVSATNPCPSTSTDHEQATELLASAARTDSTSPANGSAVTGKGKYSVAIFELDVTVAGTEAGDTLDAFVQTRIDGTNWIDVVHFAQVIGTDTTKRQIAKIISGLAQAEFEVATGLGVGAVRNILGDEYRVRFEIVEVTGDNSSFTFSVTANFIG